MEAADYEEIFETYSPQGDARYRALAFLTEFTDVISRLLFANFTSSLLIVNSTLLTYAALALLGLAGQTSRILDASV